MLLSHNGSYVLFRVVYLKGDFDSLFSGVIEEDVVVGEDAAGLIAADGVEERSKDRQGVPVLARSKVLNPLVDVMGVPSSTTRPQGVVCSGWEVHALRETCFQEPVMTQRSWPLQSITIIGHFFFM